MINIFSQAMKYIRGDDLEQEDYEQDYLENEQEDNNNNKNNIKASHQVIESNSNNKLIDLKSRRDMSNNKILSVNAQMQVVITYPTDVDDAAASCDYIKQNKTCVINLEGIDKTQAQRIADFLGGAAYALNGDVQRVSSDIFIVAPANVNIIGDLREELKNNGLILPWVSSSKF